MSTNTNLQEGNEWYPAIQLEILASDTQGTQSMPWKSCLLEACGYELIDIYKQVTRYDCV